jgi:hypothetical protein
LHQAVEQHGKIEIQLGEEFVRRQPSEGISDAAWLGCVRVCNDCEKAYYRTTTTDEDIPASSAALEGNKHGCKHWMGFRRFKHSWLLFPAHIVTVPNLVGDLRQITANYEPAAIIILENLEWRVIK